MRMHKKMRLNDPGRAQKSLNELKWDSAHYHNKITIALKFMSYIDSDLPIPAKKLQTPG